MIVVDALGPFGARARTLALHGAAYGGVELEAPLPQPILFSIVRLHALLDLTIPGHD